MTYINVASYRSPALFESHLRCVVLISPLKFHTQHSIKNTSNIYHIITVLLNTGPIHLNNQRHHRWKTANSTSTTRTQTNYTYKRTDSFVFNSVLVF